MRCPTCQQDPCGCHPRAGLWLALGSVGILAAASETVRRRGSQSFGIIPGPYARAGAMVRAPGGSMALSEHEVDIHHNPEDGTVAKGNTRPIKQLLKRNRFRWYRAGGFWYIPRTRGVASSPIDLDALKAEAQAILSGETPPPNVVPFRKPTTPRKRPPVIGHAGDVTFLLPDGGSVSLSDIYGSTGIRFGTNAPYAVRAVTPDRIGFADDPAIVVDMLVKREDIDSVVPIARQLAMINAQINGIHIDLRPSVKIRRLRTAMDRNPSSRSVGKNKRMAEVEYIFRVQKESLGMSPGGTPRYYSFIRGRYGGGGAWKDEPRARALTREEIEKSGHVATDQWLKENA